MLANLEIPRVNCRRVPIENTSYVFTGSGSTNMESQTHQRQQPPLLLKQQKNITHVRTTNSTTKTLLLKHTYVHTFACSSVIK